MRLLHLIPSADPRFGGTVAWAVTCCLVLEELGHRSDLATCDEPPGPALPGVRTIALGPAHGNYSYARRLVPWLRGNACNYDAALVHGLWQYPGLAARRALASSGTPYFVVPHGMLDPWFRRAHPIKHVKKAAYWWLAERSVSEAARAVLFTSQDELHLARRSFALEGSRLCVSRLGVRDAWGSNGESCPAVGTVYPEQDGENYLLHMCRMHPVKGGDLLLQAFAACRAVHPDLHLVMAGPFEGAWGKHLLRLTVGLGLSEHVHFLGLVSGEAKTALLRGADALVSPSREDTFPMSVLEALACGVPVLLSEGVRIWREVCDCGAGVAEPCSRNGVQRLLERWAQMDLEGRAEMAAHARQCFERMFEVHKAVEGLVSVLREHGVHG